MSVTLLTGNAHTQSLGIMEELFYFTGILKNLSSTRAQYSDNTLRNKYFNNGKINSAISNVVAFIMNRNICVPQNFEKVDEDITLISSECEWTDISTDTAADAKYSRDVICRAIANFCAEHKFYWANHNCTSYQMDRILDTKIGRYLYLYDCFISQQIKQSYNTQGSQSASQPTQPAQPTQQSSTSGQYNSNGQYIAKDGYKLSGPRSKDIINLIGNPGEKIIITKEVYFITAKNPKNHNVIGTYVMPLSQHAQQGDKNKVSIGFANRRGEAFCYFETKDAAEEALEKFIATANAEVQARIQSNPPFIIAKKPNKNGYFKVATAIGDALIHPIKVNEDLEDIDKPEEQENSNEYEDRFNCQSDNSIWSLEFAGALGEAFNRE